MNIEALAEWQSSARRGLEHEIEALQDRERQQGGLFFLFKDRRP